MAVSGSTAEVGSPRLPLLAMSAGSTVNSATRRFGTFGGVFTPNVLTILGVILYLRTGWVVGNAGLKQGLIILVLANGITLLTTLSLSSIATNTKVGGGGAYFLISCSLGLEIGESIGVPLYLAQAISIAFYIIGFTESLLLIWPDLDTQLTGAVVLAGLLCITLLGAELAIKTQYLHNWPVGFWSAAESGAICRFGFRVTVHG